MNIGIPLLIALPLFWVAYKFYGNYLANKVLGLDPNRITPAQQRNDGRDYVPSKLSVVFAHHFASIAGAGPIIGPTVALIFGYIPVWLWIVFGGIFIGAVHDFTAIFVSLREGGKSMAEVAHKTLGKPGFVLFISFTIVMILLVTAAFLDLTAKALGSLVPISLLRLPESQTMLYTLTQDGVVKARIGGIASTSVIIMTIFAPVAGFFLYKKAARPWIMSIIAIVVGVTSIIIGMYIPVTMTPRWWQVIISVYVLFAAGIPVWLLLQPRDFINVHILYLGIVILFIAIVSGTALGLQFNFPMFNIAEGIQNLGWIWPMLFITVACGAISGFHALVAGGTTCKQVSNETAAKRVGFAGMLLESVLAICAFTAVAAGLSFIDFKQFVFPGVAGKDNPILAFAVGMGTLLHDGLGIHTAYGTIFGILMLEGFIITTLDTAVRLNRYLFEELWGLLFHRPVPLLRSYWFNAGLSVILMFFLCYTNQFKVLWPIFGTANQLLAALTLIAVSSWLLLNGKKIWVTILPACFMMATTTISLIILLTKKYIPTQNYILISADILLLALSFGVVALALRKIRKLPVKISE
ncbi:MAG: carbon starvation protein A [bacterium]|nr:carbon starvation protein A [bacterium]